MTSAHGQDATRNVSARYTQTRQPPRITDGTMASTAARPTTIGVYTRANTVMKRSTGALRSCASSTIVRIRLTEDSASGLVTRAVITPLRETKPASTVSPGSALRATLSPVSAEVSISLMPVSTTASSGTRSPGRMRISSPTCTCAGSTAAYAPSRRTNASSGLIASSALTCLRERPTA